MKLYHGTSAKHLEAILKDGLQPRGRRAGNWSHTTKSRSDCVYLTDAYAPYFCFSAVNGRKEPLAEAKCLVLEIDSDRLHQGRLLPDEDTLTHGIRPEGEIPADMRKRTQYFRNRLLRYMNTDVWRTSLEYLGTCAYYGRIPPEAITRWVTWPHKPNISLGFVWDPCITPINYKICGSSYRDGTKRLFGDAVGEAPAGILSSLYRFEVEGLTRYARV